METLASSIGLPPFSLPVLKLEVLVRKPSLNFHHSQLPFLQECWYLSPLSRCLKAAPYISMTRQRKPEEGGRCHIAKDTTQHFPQSKFLQLKTLSLVFFPFYSDYYCWKVSLPFRRWYLEWVSPWESRCILWLQLRTLPITSVSEMPVSSEVTQRGYLEMHTTLALFFEIPLNWEGSLIFPYFSSLS